MNLSENGKIIMTSYLQKRSRFFHIWQNRFCVLTEKFFFIYKGVEKNSQCIDSINLSECTKVNDSDQYLGKRNTFELVHRDRSYFFMCKNKDTQEEWIEAVEQIIEESNGNKISNASKEK